MDTTRQYRPILYGQAVILHWGFSHLSKILYVATDCSKDLVAVAWENQTK